MWTQVKEAKDESRHELLIVGKELNSELLSSNGILDPCIFDLHLLNFLRLANSSLEIIPEEIGNLSNLSSLELQNNKIISLPNAIGKLTKLKLLDISDNKLESFPQELNSLCALTTFNARGNAINELIAFESSTSLSIVDLRNNKLKSIAAICSENHKSITEILASNNNIDVIPEDIQHLQCLKNLSLATNSIKEIPSEILNCNKLKEIDLKGNPLSDRRLKKLVESERGFSRTVLDYFKQHLKPKGKSDSGKNKKKGGSKHQEEVDELCNKLTVLSAKQDLIVKCTAEVKSVRGNMICCIFKNLDLSGSKLRTFLSIQTKLHETLCEKRVAATIATHDLVKVKSPLTYCALPPEGIMIQPLNRNTKISAREFYKQLQEEAEALRKQMKRNSNSGIHKYLSLVDGLEKWSCLVDSEGTVISLPPITNAANTKIENETKDVLVEITSSSSLKTCKVVMEALILDTVKAELVTDKTQSGKKSMVVEQVRILDEDSNFKLIFPSRTDLVFNEDIKLSVCRI